MNRKFLTTCTADSVFTFFVQLENQKMRKRTIVKPKAVADTGSGSVQKEEYSVKVTVSMVYLPRL